MSNANLFVFRRGSLASTNFESLFVLWPEDKRKPNVGFHDEHKLPRFTKSKKEERKKKSSNKFTDRCPGGSSLFGEQRKTVKIQMDHGTS